jgi:hypothetical protein
MQNRGSSVVLVISWTLTLSGAVADHRSERAEVLSQCAARAGPPGPSERKALRIADGKTMEDDAWRLLEAWISWILAQSLTKTFALLFALFDGPGFTALLASSCIHFFERLRPSWRTSRTIYSWNTWQVTRWERIWTFKMAAYGSPFQLWKGTYLQRFHYTSSQSSDVKRR